MPMDDYDQSQYQEVSNVPKRFTGGTRNIGNVVLGLIFGLLFTVGGFYLAVSNEVNGWKTYHGYVETAKAVVAVPISPVYQKNNMHVIFLSGLATSEETLTDPLLMVSGQALRLNRKVENYQWQEASKDVKTSNGKRTPSYSYSKAWREDYLPSAFFKHPEGHENPIKPLFNSNVVEAKKITLGDFTLPGELYKDITTFVTVDISNVDLSNIQKATQSPLFRSDSEIYIGADPKNPQVGDTRIMLTEVLSQEVSVIGQQSGDTLQPYKTHTGESVLLLMLNHQTPQAMLKNVESSSDQSMLLLRIVSLFLIILGLFLLLMPLNALANSSPAVAMLIPPATFFSTVLVGALVWCMALAVAWMSIKPKIAVGLGAVILVLLVVLIKMKKPRAPVAAAVDTSPEPSFPIEDDEKYNPPSE
jgi:hypothetical protein